LTGQHFRIRTRLLTRDPSRHPLLVERLHFHAPAAQAGVRDQAKWGEIHSGAPLTIVMYGRMREGATPVLNAVREDSLNWIRTDPDMDPVRNDSRFQEMYSAAEARLAAQKTG
jgi:hypothetical protein